MTHRRPHPLAWLLAALLLVPCFARAAGVQAALDRDRAQLGETVTLNLRLEGGGSIGTPDLSPLQADFDVLGSSSNTSVSIVNGRRSAETIVGIALRPRHAGRLVVPPLLVNGERTQPLSLDVAPATPGASPPDNGGKDVYLEAAAEPAAVRVGQQLVYTLRLYYRATLANGTLEDPQLPGADVRKLGGDLGYEAERGGRDYHVIERRYALVPQRAGRLEIPALGFQGVQVDPNDPDSFFGVGKQVSAAAPPVAVDVQPPPADWGRGADWLPARSLSLDLDGLPADGRVRAGQALNLHMAVQAVGLPYEALPALSLPTPDGATVYPDKPSNGTRVDGQWLVGRREQSFAVVPAAPGKLHLPAITLKWWNVQTGKAEVATIPARDLDVLPASGAAAADPTAGATAPASAASTASAVAASPQARPVTGTPVALLPSSWQAWIAAAGLLLAGVALGWWLGRRGGRASSPSAAPSPAPPAPSARHLRDAFLAAARGTDSAAQAGGLLAWARAERPALRNLGELADALASPAQRAAIADLQRRRYADAPPAPGASLAEAFADGFAWRDGGAGGPASPLPPLYPFKLR